MRATLKLEEGKGSARLTHRSPMNEEEQVLHSRTGPPRGTVELPDPGLIEVGRPVRWSITLRRGPSSRRASSRLTSTGPRGAGEDTPC